MGIRILFSWWIILMVFGPCYSQEFVELQTGPSYAWLSNKHSVTSGYLSSQPNRFNVRPFIQLNYITYISNTPLSFMGGIGYRNGATLDKIKFRFDLEDTFHHQKDLQNRHFIYIPLQLQYRLQIYRQHTLHIGLGMQYALLMASDLLIEFDKDQQRQAKTIAFYDPRAGNHENRFDAALLFTARYSYARWALQFSVCHSVNPSRNNGNEKLRHCGLGIGYAIFRQ